MKNIIKRIKQKIEGLNNKSGFTLIESIVAIGIFALSSVILVLFVGQSTLMINKSANYDQQKRITEQVLNSGKSDVNYRAITNLDGKKIDNKNKNNHGKNKVDIEALVDINNSIVFGPKKDANQDDYAIKSITEIDQKINDKHKTSVIDMKGITVTIYDDKNKPVRTRIVGVVDDKKN